MTLSWLSCDVRTGVAQPTNPRELYVVNLGPA